MEFGEVIGILFLLVVTGIFGRYVNHHNGCPGCGRFRTVKRIEARYTPVDDETDVKDIIWHLLSQGEYQTKSSIIEWVDRCSLCGYETTGEQFFEHF